MALCRTCLGPLDLPINLFELIYKPLLDLLQLLLAYQVYVPNYEFNICCHCRGKLKWTLEFQSKCLKSLESLQSVDYNADFHLGNEPFVKTEPPPEGDPIKLDVRLLLDANIDKLQSKNDTSQDDVDSTSLDNDRETPEDPSYFPGDNDDSGSDYQCPESSRKRKRPVRASRSKITVRKDLANSDCEEERNNDAAEENFDESPYDCAKVERYMKTRKRRGVRKRNVEVLERGGIKFQHFPFDEVQKAIMECNDANSHTIDVENTTCLLCNFQGKIRRTLTRHMNVSHKHDVPNWCRYCNVFTDNLPQHALKCYYERCKFCDMKLSSVYALKKHLRQHCSREESNQLILKDPTNLRKVLDQHPKEQVLQAIANCTAHTTELKYRTCLHCNCVVVRSTFLTPHMRLLHKKQSTTWCARCNLQTEHLQLHLDATKCSEIRCPFCTDDNLKNVYELVTHLRLHSNELALQEEPNNTVAPNEVRADEETVGIHRPESVSLTEGGETSTKTDYELFIPNAIQNEDILNVALTDVLENVKKNDEKAVSFFVEQFPKDMVNQAILELNNFTNDAKFRRCVVCNQHCNELFYLRSHMKTKHKDKFAQWCRNCNLITEDLSGHHDLAKCNQKTCTLCSKIYPSYRCVRRHMNSHYHTNDAPEGRPEKTICPICGNYYKNVTQHMYTSHNKKTEEKLTCPHCDKTFKSKVTLKCHIKRHSTKKTIPCNICGKTFRKHFEMKTHMEVHDGGPVQCIVCDKVLPRPGVLKLHMRKHTGENKHKCEQCGKSYHKKTLLNLHLVSHSDERPYKCNFCEKRFKILPTLRHHEQTHEGLRPYKCTICNFKAVQCNALTIHMKLHPEDAPQAGKPYKCLLCYRSFSTNAVLQSHTEYIHGENRKKKEACAQAEGLTVHMMQHPEDAPLASKPHKCLFCYRSFSTNALLLSHNDLSHKNHDPDSQ